MARRRLRLALDANVLIAGIRWPRWPYEVLRAVLLGDFDVRLPALVIAEARRHLPEPEQRADLEYFLDSPYCQIVPMAPRELVDRNRDLVRSDKDVPIALALMADRVQLFVTTDRDFTDPDATSSRFREQVRSLLPAVFLREVIGWDSPSLEAVRTRTWDEFQPPPDPSPAA